MSRNQSSSPAHGSSSEKRPGNRSHRKQRGGEAAGDSSAAPPSHTPKPDRGFAAIVTLLVAIAVWLVLMPWSPDITRAAMERFHLRTGSFLAWAIQFPIPAMYNFANRYEVDRYPPGLIDPIFDESEPRYINHFPVRCVTFADGRFLHLRQGQDRWITVETSYRGRSLETRFHAKANPDGGFEFNRLFTTEGQR